MKKVISVVITILLIVGILYVGVNYGQEITHYAIDKFVMKKEIIVPSSNQYKKTENFQYVQNTDNFKPSNKQEILNIYYTVLNSGWTDFTFYCPNEYTNCIEDVKSISKDDNTLSNINNFVHPYNSYDNIKTLYNDYGKVNLKITKTYDNDQVAVIDEKANQIYTELINDSMTLEQKIQTIHDYIINSTKYDQSFGIGAQSNTYEANNAYGPLFQGFAICSGYSDAMAIFLSKMNIPNIKIASEKHLWNLVQINGRWVHLDLTWDDPVTSNGSDMLLHKFFLIDTPTLESLDLEQHNFDKTVYVEAT